MMKGYGREKSFVTVRFDANFQLLKLLVDKSI